MFNIKTSSVVSSYKNDLEKISPLEAIKVLTWMAQSDYDITTIANKIDKLTSVFFNPLRHEFKPPPDQHFLFPYQCENSALLSHMEEMRPLLGEILINRNSSSLATVQNLTGNLKSHSSHFYSLEILVFPLFEQVLPQYGAYVRFESLFHNKFKQMLREIEYLFTTDAFDYELFNKLVGRLYFQLSLRLYRENLIIFPVGSQFIHDRFYQLTLVNESY
jgi:hypothetical protein